MNPAWQAAMTQEIKALHSNNTWDLVPLPAGKKALGCKWVHIIKHKSNGGVERFKARLVVKGYTQQAGIDYTETFSPVVKMTIVRGLIATAIKKGWQHFQLDVNNAFLHETFMKKCIWMYLMYFSMPYPLDPSIKLKVYEGTLLPDPTYYRKLIGKLNFLTNTRLDIACSVQYLGQYMQSPIDPHLEVAFHVLRYLKEDPNLDIFLSNSDE
ncbi:putative mitochondrial protein AtMg00820 [Nicotiana tabacum]|uniref:Mitochondrial protein AtMg00820 n=1 Tax=Nicotiana tabacum TaxID=4097 RepID=A0A1S4AK57_TOBAC|nr:PREDICTED: uncharacterized mitochondrial protein AtMg00820-like [Nicotiana tabacum]